MKSLCFNYRDLFLIPRLALSFQRILINGIGLFSGFLIYLSSAYLSLAAGGLSFRAMWLQFGLIPLPLTLELPWFSLAIYYLGILLAVAILLLTNTAVSRSVYMALREHRPYSWIRAIRFALKKWISILGAGLTLSFLLGIFVAGALVLGFLGRIPLIGEFGTAILFLPYFFATLVFLFIAVVCVVGLVLIPAMLATADEDGLGAVFQVFSITFQQPGKFVSYFLITMLLEFFGILVLAAVFHLAYLTFLNLFSVGMGDKLLQLSDYAVHLVNRAFPAVFAWLNSILTTPLGGLVYVPHHLAVAEAASQSGLIVSAYILAFSLILLGGIVLAYGEAIGNSGLTLTYILLYKAREGENLLVREDDEITETGSKPDDFPGVNEIIPDKKGGS